MGSTARCAAIYLRCRSQAGLTAWWMAISIPDQTSEERSLAMSTRKVSELRGGDHD
jgi:hypothetical protein